MTIGFFIFPSFQLPDLSGPLTAFELAQRFHGVSAYKLKVLSLHGGPIESSSGMIMMSEPLEQVDCDTLFIIGSDTMDAVCQCPETRQAIREKRS